MSFMGGVLLCFVTLSCMTLQGAALCPCHDTNHEPAAGLTVASAVCQLRSVISPCEQAGQAATTGKTLFKIAGHPLMLTGSVRTRDYEWSYFNPGPVKNGGSQNEYNYQANVLRLGLGYQRGGVKVFAEMMNPSLFDLPERASAPSPVGALGLGANHFQLSSQWVAATVFLKQAYIEIEKEGLHIQGGRFDYGEGADSLPQDPQLRWVVLNQIQQRLLGDFGWGDVMRSYDGGKVRYGSGNWNATLMAGIPTQGVYDIHGMDEINRVNVAYGALNAGPGALWGNSVGRVFYIHYEDGRGLIPVDNEPKLAAAANRGPIRIETIGADYAHTMDYGPGTFDVLAWGVYQFGSWGNQAQRAEAFTAQAGYRFDDAPWQPWLRLLYTFGSGDKNPGDSAHGTFFQVLPSPRAYALDPFHNMMNLKDAGAEIILSPRKAVEWRTTVHGIWLASSSDLWYMGAGTFDNSSFGYMGRPSYGHSYLATVVDTGPAWKPNHHLSLSLYVGHAFGGPVIAANFPGGREETFAYAESLLSF